MTLHVLSSIMSQSYTDPWLLKSAFLWLHSVQDSDGGFDSLSDARLVTTSFILTCFLATFALDALDYFKIRTGGYRCSVLVSELNLNGASGEYKAAVLSLVNCLILGTEVLRLRHSIRNELIGKTWFSLS